MRRTLMLSMLFAAAALVFLLARPSPSQELDPGTADDVWVDAGDGDVWQEDGGWEDAGWEDDDVWDDDDWDDEDGGYHDLIDAGFDPFVDAGPDPIPLPDEDEGSLTPRDSFEPPVVPPAPGPIDAP